MWTLRSEESDMRKRWKIFLSKICLSAVNACLESLPWTISGITLQKRARRVLNMLSRQRRREGRRQRDADVDAPAAEKRQEKCENKPLRKDFFWRQNGPTSAAKPLRKDILRDITKIMECPGDRLPAIRYRQPLNRGEESSSSKDHFDFEREKTR